jgi:hypothetical protein
MKSKIIHAYIAADIILWTMASFVLVYSEEYPGTDIYSRLLCYTVAFALNYISIEYLDAEYKRKYPSEEDRLNELIETIGT